MNQRRRALLLAIAEYQRIEKLPYVHGDVPRMVRALKLMGVPDNNIQAHGAGGNDSFSISTGHLRTLVREFLDSAEAEEDLTIYFSGHGVEQDGHRLLVPQDYNKQYPLPASEMVSDGDLAAWARASKAASVLFVIDACREGVRLELAADTKSIAAPRDAADLTPSNDTPTIAIVFSCAARQSSGVDRDKGECSAFTRAFAEALEMDGNRNRLAQVSADAQKLLTDYQVVPQTIILDPRVHGRRGSPHDLIVKESTATRFLDQLANSDWVRRLKCFQPWQMLEAAEPTLATQVASIVLKAEHRVDKAAEVLPQQHWRAPDAPFRTLERIAEHLLSGMVPTPAELGVMLAVPFVYEVVLAEAEQRLVEEGAGLDPLVPDERDEDTAFRRAWRTAGLNDEAGRRLVVRLRERGKADAARDLAAWRFNTFCHRDGELWDAGTSGWATAALGACCVSRG
jgi:hypothetical protein